MRFWGAGVTAVGKRRGEIRRERDIAEVVTEPLLWERPVEPKAGEKAVSSAGGANSECSAVAPRGRDIIAVD